MYSVQIQFIHFPNTPSSIFPVAVSKCVHIFCEKSKRLYLLSSIPHDKCNTCLQCTIKICLISFTLCLVFGGLFEENMVNNTHQTFCVMNVPYSILRNQKIFLTSSGGDYPCITCSWWVIILSYGRCYAITEIHRAHNVTCQQDLLHLCFIMSA